jgi:hypothetical protein
MGCSGKRAVDLGGTSLLGTGGRTGISRRHVCDKHFRLATKCIYVLGGDEGLGPESEWDGLFW